MELISKLGIDWKLLIAQIINFCILLGILYKFAYKPVLGALEKRSKRIEQGLKQASESEERMREIDKMRDVKLREAEHQVGKLIEDARKDAERMRKEIVDAANSQAEALVIRAKTQIEEEKVKMVADLKHEIAGIVIQATGRILEREFSNADQSRLTEAISKEMKV